AEALFQAEVAIHEADRIQEGALLDEDVLVGLEDMVLELRGEGRTDVEETDDSEWFLPWNIKKRWQELFENRSRHSNSDLAGILRTIMNSVRIRSSMRPGGRGYLDFLKGYMADLGVRVQKLGKEEAEHLQIIDRR